ncbi:pentatricopeptide repeat (PPR) superfamily protein [Striga asiatica]|uniref:Pentatricopeptide repeat (PPR) superfamily protein n=1 Tax=Striga asiatica TaxID=4170 RepID=A0A5A7Q448_STRAF|nr:pentatricopeptide repeat (PPR) superfamily protein [Striga asiatica]
MRFRRLSFPFLHMFSGSGPSRLLLDASNCSRAERRPNSAGSFPENPLLNSIKSESFRLKAIISGTSPDKKLFLKWKDSTCRAARLAGIFPVKPFWEKSNRRRDVRFENVSGISPDSCSIWTAFAMPPMVAGIFPCNPFCDTSKFFTDLRFPIESGISPTRLEEAACKSSRFASWPMPAGKRLGSLGTLAMVGGISPEKLLEERSKILADEFVNGEVEGDEIRAFGDGVEVESGAEIVV